MHNFVILQLSELWLPKNVSQLFFEAISFCNVLSDSVFMRHFVILIILWAIEGIVWPPSGSTANTYNLSSLYS